MIDAFGRPQGTVAVWMLAAHCLWLSVGVVGVHQAPLPTINRGIISETGRGITNNTTTGGESGPWGLVEVMKGNWTHRGQNADTLNSCFSGHFIRMKNQLMKPDSCPVLVEQSRVICIFTAAV